MKRYVTRRESAPWLSPLCLVPEKNCMIWHFGLSRSPRKKFPRDFGT